MTNAIVYSSRTGNTKMLAETIKNEISEDCCIYFGSPNDAALKADRIYVGFWTDKGSCNEQTKVFLQSITNQQVYLFGTAGFGGSQDYFDKVLKRIRKFVSSNASIIGCFMCQGKMPITVRQRYEKMMKNPNKIPNLKEMIENFDRALDHPNQKDLDALRNALHKRIQKTSKI